MVLKMVLNKVRLRLVGRLMIGWLVRALYSIYDNRTLKWTIKIISLLCRNTQDSIGYCFVHLCHLYFNTRELTHMMAMLLQIQAIISMKECFIMMKHFKKISTWFGAHFRSTALPQSVKTPLLFIFCCFPGFRFIEKKRVMIARGDNDEPLTVPLSHPCPRYTVVDTQNKNRHRFVVNYHLIFTIYEVICNTSQAVSAVSSADDTHLHTCRRHVQKHKILQKL